MPYDPLYYYIVRNAYIFEYKDILEYLDANPVLHKDFTYWFQTLIKTRKEPSYQTIVTRLEELAYKHKIPSMALVQRYKRNYNDAFAGISDAEANAAADAALRQLAARKRPYRPPMITIRKPFPVRSTAKPRLEVKGMDTKLGSLPIVDTVNTNDSIAVLNLVQQGAGSWNRVGRKIFPKSIRIKGSILVTSAWSTTNHSQYGNYLRCILVWDKQPSGAAIPQFDHMFGVTEQTGAESTTIMSPLKYDNMDRFIVLKEWVLSSNPGSSGSYVSPTGAGVHNIITFDEFYRFKGKFETVYSGQSNPMTLADISTGALYIVFRSRATSLDPTSSIALQPDVIARLRYTD